MRAQLCILAALLPGALSAAGRWQMQYFHDEAESSFHILDLAFPTAQRGIAVGYLADKGRNRGSAALTIDGGAHWTAVRLPSPAVSCFFLNESVGWIVTEKGIYQTIEGGRSWKKIPAPKEILRVHFLTPERGFGVGLRKSVFETADGGKRWTRVAAADAVKARPEYTAFTWITFVTPQVGMIIGYNRPPRRASQEFPDWMEPEKAVSRSEWPTMSVSLETRDGGKTWNAATTSIFGRIARVRLTPEGRGLGLVEFAESFAYPSEVFSLAWRSGKSLRAFRERDRAVTDVAVAPSGPGYLAAIGIPGKLLRAPIPGKLHILTSGDLSTWTEMEVDYRANARRAMFASAGARDIWVATDTGMILKLVE
ncbi:MAG: hypothetical protein ACE15B_15195 [Bryobacteraceae bacterium]